MTVTSDAPRVPVTRERIATCLDSARLWARELPRYADRQQRRADAWSIAAGVLAALTSLSVFPLLTGDSAEWGRWLVAGMARAGGDPQGARCAGPRHGTPAGPAAPQ